MEKRTSYLQLVDERKNCRKCDGLKNPSCVEGPLDSNEIGPWTRWQGNLDTELMVVGQDFSSVEYFMKHKGWDKPKNPTNRNLIELLAVAGFKIEDVNPNANPPIRGEVFFTNVVLCLKTGTMNAPIRSEWVTNCGEKFLKKTVEIVRPKAMVTLGKHATKAVAQVYGLQNIDVDKFASIVESNDATILEHNVRFFPVFHCSPMVVRTGTRTLEKMKDDWRKIGSYLGREAVQTI